MTKKELLRKKIILRFIDAVHELSREIGLDNLTVRNIAQKAGFNSATLYNYFENYDHLIFYVAMKNIGDYALALNEYTKKAENAMDLYMMVWECFCDYAYAKPQIYKTIFFPDLEGHFEDYVAEYYSVFPEDMVTTHAKLSSMLFKSDISKRGLTTVMACVEEGYIPLEDKDKLNDMTLLIFEGMLTRVLRGQVSWEEARRLSMEYIKNIVSLFLVRDYSFHF